MAVAARACVTFKTNPKTGELMAARMVDPTHELMLIAEDGIVLRTPVEHISSQGRSTQGVTLMDVDRENRGNKIAAVAVIDMEREYGTPEALPTGATVAGEEIAPDGLSAGANVTGEDIAQKAQKKAPRKPAPEASEDSDDDAPSNGNANEESDDRRSRPAATASRQEGQVAARWAASPTGFANWESRCPPGVRTVSTLGRRGQATSCSSREPGRWGRMA